MAVTTHPHLQPNQISRLLRCQRTQRYFTGEAWSDAPDQARNYPNEMDAVRSCVENGLRDVELVLRAGFADILCTPVR